MDQSKHPLVGLGDQVYRSDRWTQYQWQRFVEGDERAKDVLERGSRKVYSFPRFGQEIFQRLHGDTADRLDRIKPEDEWAAKAHDEVSALPDFERLRRRCRADRLQAGIAATTFLDRVLDGLPDPPRSIEDPEALRQQVRGLLEFARKLEHEGKDNTEVEGLIEELRERGQEAVRSAKAFGGKLDPSDLRRALREASRIAHKAVDRAVEQVDAFCSWGTGAITTADVVGDEIKAELARHVAKNKKLQALAQQAGRMKRIAAAKQRSKADHARDEVTDIERGADLQRLLPSELVKLTDPVLSLEFARGFFERSLLQYKLTGSETLGRGPIIVCIDQSSSMKGSKEIWSKALALALLQVAVLQKRRCRVVHFNGAVVRVDDWSPGRIDPLELVASMEPFYGGGTAFEPPLSSALDAIRDLPDLKKADVVLVTDGEAAVSGGFATKWAAAKKSQAFTCYAVHVDAPGGVAPTSLQAIADNVLGLADIANDQGTTDVILSI